MQPTRVISRHTKDLDTEYKWGFTTEVEEEVAPKGIDEDVIRYIWAKKQEPEWMLEWRLRAYRYWASLKYEEPRWASVHFPPIDYQGIHYYAAPKSVTGASSLEEVDPEIRKAFDKLGIPLQEQSRLAGVAVDAVFDSVSVATTFKEKLAQLGIIFCSFSEAVLEQSGLAAGIHHD
ncbi:MAG: Fe-S cluster assembly protein SufB, partial [Armatimonadetes bacterium]|nr:Fe-S cluster assembly protein SufB [Armatimonadota bacterium]